MERQAEKPGWLQCGAGGDRAGKKKRYLEEGQEAVPGGLQCGGEGGGGRGGEGSKQNHTC